MRYWLFLRHCSFSFCLLLFNMIRIWLTYVWQLVTTLDLAVIWINDCIWGNLQAKRMKCWQKNGELIYTRTMLSGAAFTIPEPMQRTSLFRTSAEKAFDKTSHKITSVKMYHVKSYTNVWEDLHITSDWHIDVRRLLSRSRTNKTSSPYCLVQLYEAFCFIGYYIRS